MADSYFLLFTSQIWSHSYSCLEFSKQAHIQHIFNCAAHIQHIFNWPTKCHQNTGIIQPLPSTSTTAWSNITWSSTVITIRSDTLPLQGSWLPVSVPSVQNALLPSCSVCTFFGSWLKCHPIREVFHIHPVQLPPHPSETPFSALSTLWHSSPWFIHSLLPSLNHRMFYSLLCLWYLKQHLA